MFAEGLKQPRGGNSWQARNAASAEFDPTVHRDALFVFVVDRQQRLWVVPNGPHLHPTVLGGGEPALFAGELDVDASGVVVELNNLSGTFRFRKADGLKCVADLLLAKGIALAADALNLYSRTGRAGVSHP